MIIIFPFSRKLRNGNENAKNFPISFWKELIKMLKKDDEIIQLGVEGEEQLVSDFRKNLLLKEIKSLLKECRFWISVDSFGVHLANTINKKGVGLYSISDPLIFGYSQNLNILKDRKYLRKNQFATWEEAEHDKEAYLSAEEVYKIIRANGLL